MRPLRASNLRKDRMGEELLAHLTRLFDEECREVAMPSPLRPKRSAVLATRQPLTRELQAGVPWLERWAFFSLRLGPFRRRRGESPLRYLLRASCWGLAISIVAYSLFPLVLLLPVAGGRIAPTT